MHVQALPYPNSYQDITTTGNITEQPLTIRNVLQICSTRVNSHRHRRKQTQNGMPLTLSN